MSLSAVQTKWCAEFAKNYPRTQTFMETTFVKEIKLWTPEIVLFVILQSSFIPLNFKANKYWNLLTKPLSGDDLEKIIDLFTKSYLENAIKNIAFLWEFIRDWSIVFKKISIHTSFLADAFVLKMIKQQS